MTAGAPDDQEPQGALHRVAREVAALRASAGNPSLRRIENLVRADEKEATASRQTISVILRAKQRTRLDTLRAVVLHLVRLDDTRSPEEEQRVWSRIEALWYDALREETSEAAPETTAAVQRFAARLRASVLTPLGGDFDALCGRLRPLLPDGEPDDGVTPAALSAVAQGTRTPRHREVALLLDLLARDGRPLSQKERQSLMLDYIEVLRRCAPILYRRFMTDELLDAYRGHAERLEERARAADTEREERRRQKLSHRADQARLAARLKRLEGDAAAARDRATRADVAREEAVGALVILREERDKLAALTTAHQPATHTLPSWNSLAPQAVIADFADPDAQYGYSAAQYDWPSTPYDRSALYDYDYDHDHDHDYDHDHGHDHGHGSYDTTPFALSQPSYDTYDPGDGHDVRGWNTEPYGLGQGTASVYHAARPSAPVRTLPAPAGAVPSRRLVIVAFPHVPLPHVPLPHVPLPHVPLPDVPLPGRPLPDVPPPTSRGRLRTFAARFRRSHGRHARGRQN
ncbi:hypothetical protein [Streptomyces sp. NPDC059894]|uniref:hypothetical protein n=1 Tax=unclassified Streptomyces TaxID=2593676 RepID=UPI0036613DF9